MAFGGITVTIRKPRRTPLGTLPPEDKEPVAATEPAQQASGTIEAKPEADRERLAADQEHSVIVQIDDDWLQRLDIVD